MNQDCNRSNRWPMRSPVVWAVMVQISLLVPATSGQEDWLNWRGPQHNGLARAQPPIRWSETQNVRWKTTLPGEGASTPIVVDGRVYVLAAVPNNNPAPPRRLDPRQRTLRPKHGYDFRLICVNANNGKILWQRTAVRAAPHEGRHATNTYAGGSPCSDGERIFACFGSHGLFCYSIDGQLQWKRDLGQMRTRRGWGEAVTPVWHRNRLIVNWDHEDASFLYSLDATTGDTIWRKDRPGEVTSWNTPLCVDIADDDADASTATSTLVIVNGTNAARAYQWETGEVRWSCGGQTVNAIPTPVRIGEAVLCMSGYRGQAGACIPLRSKGVVQPEQCVWRYDKDTPYVPSPTVFGNSIFFTKTNDPILTALNAETGQVVLGAKRLPSLARIYASPLAADGRIYIADREGATAVLDADTGVVLAINRLPEGVDASPVAVGKRLYLRSNQTLYCIE